MKVDVERLCPKIEMRLDGEFMCVREREHDGRCNFLRPVNVVASKELLDSTMNGRLRSVFDGAGVPQARTADPETSHEAAQTVSDLSERRRDVYDVLGSLGDRGVIDETLVYVYEERARRGEVVSQSPSGIRSRRAELVKLGFVEHTGEYDKTRAGGRARSWRAVPKP